MPIANVAAVLLAIYVSKRISERKAPNLRFAKVNRSETGDVVLAEKKALYVRVWKVLRFILSLMGIREALIAGGLAASLIARSIFHLKLLHVSTSVENGVMKGNDKEFWTALRTFSLCALPASALYAVFNYGLSELALHVRQRVSERLLGKFTTNSVFYQTINAEQLQSIQPLGTLGARGALGEREALRALGTLGEQGTGTGMGAEALRAVPNPDQLLTIDIEHFSYALSGLFSHVMRPVVDILVNATRLYTTSGALIPAVMGIYLVVSSNLLNYIRGPMASFTDREQDLEGEYRCLIARITTSAEEIAALEGGRNEQHNVLRSLRSLVDYSRSFSQFRCNMSFIDSVVARYWLMILGWRLVGLHFLRDSGAGRDRDELYKDYQNMSKTMLALSRAIGALIMSGKDVVKVFAYGEKLAMFEETMEEFIRRGGYTESSETLDTLGGLGDALVVMQDVTIVAPNTPIPLHTQLNLIFRRGMHTVITGENGVGKSSLLRILAGLWPPARGRVLRPTATADLPLPVLYLPQKPYMSQASLREQIVYPKILPTDSSESALLVLDALLVRILQQVHLGYLLHPSYTLEPTELSGSQSHLDFKTGPDSPYSDSDEGFATPEEVRSMTDVGRNSRGYLLSTMVDWGEVLSGGEKQRLSMARLFYHKPLFALLDESTSAVSQEIEDELYEACIAAQDTTMITISHRPNLMKHHQYELHLGKNDSHKLAKIS